MFFFYNHINFNYRVCLILLVALFGLNTMVSAQQKSIKMSNLRTQLWLRASSDTLWLNSVSVVPNSIQLKVIAGCQAPLPIDFSINYNPTYILNKNKNRCDSIIVIYRTFPINFNASLKTDIKLKKDSNQVYIIQPMPNKQVASLDVFDFGGLDYNGNYTRGITVGNAQDLNLTSNFNLQLRGQVGDIEIMAALTDNNLPFQPDGNTQQLQEFDRIFIQLQRKNTVLLLGDFQNNSKAMHYFQRFHKKVQGVSIASNLKRNEITFSSDASYSIARGKFTRNKITAIEGNQGPYKMQGDNGEIFIIILAGSEQVYIDGQLMQRGENNDYTIDYNLSEIRFMPRQLITKDKRISVEFQYTERAYFRSIFSTSIGAQYKNFQSTLTYFNERDNKMQPIEEELTTQQINKLKNVGDSIQLAFVDAIDSVGFKQSQVLYATKDTLVDGFYYDSIYVFSQLATQAFYQIRFTQIGTNKGNYIRDFNATNGNVYKWIAPINGIKQGQFEPVELIVTPKSQGLTNLTLVYDNKKGRGSSVDVALSQYDVNTYSSINNSDDAAVAFLIKHKERFYLDSAKAWRIEPSAQIEFQQNQFKEIELFRNFEYVRDWSIDNAINVRQELLQSSAQIAITNKTKFITTYKIENLQLKATKYNATKHSMFTNYEKNKLQLNGTISILNGGDATKSIQFFRPLITSVYKINKLLSTGLRYEAEQNSIRNKQADSLYTNSFGFDIGRTWIQLDNQENISIKLEAARRYDDAAYKNQLQNSTYADEISNTIKLTFSNFDWESKAQYRNLINVDSLVSKIKNKRTLLVNTNSNLRMLRGMFQLNTNYQLNNGQEQKIEYRYIKVPEGQGQYIWIDSLFNNNGIPEINEFIQPGIAFAYQANYIRLATPSNNYISISQVQWTQSLRIIPRAYFSANSKKLTVKLLRALSNQSQLNYTTRSNENNNWLAFVPFAVSLADTSMQSNDVALRNVFSVLQSHPQYGLDITYVNNASKILLVNGFDRRNRESINNVVRFGANTHWRRTLEVYWGSNAYYSPLFTTNNFFINEHKITPNLTYQFKQNIKLSASYGYIIKKNGAVYGGEQFSANKAEIKSKYSSIDNGSVSIDFSLVNVKYIGLPSKPVSYTILEGLQAGNNYLWTVGIDRKILKNLMLNVTYDGRKTGTNKIIHVGRMQFSAIF